MFKFYFLLILSFIFVSCSSTLVGKIGEKNQGRQVANEKLPGYLDGFKVVGNGELKIALVEDADVECKDKKSIFIF